MFKVVKAFRLVIIVNEVCKVMFCFTNLLVMGISFECRVGSIGFNCLAEGIDFGYRRVVLDNLLNNQAEAD